MYIYNTSFMVDGAVHERWLALVQGEYIPLLKKEGYGRITFSRVMTEQISPQFTYSLQVAIDGIPDYRRLSGELFAEYEAIAGGVFGEQVLHFATLMKVIGD